MEGWDLERLKARRREIREALDRIRRYTALPDAEFWNCKRPWPAGRRSPLPNFGPMSVTSTR